MGRTCWLVRALVAASMMMTSGCGGDDPVSYATPLVNEDPDGASVTVRVLRSDGGTAAEAGASVSCGDCVDDETVRDAGACREPAVGCPCAEGAPPVACDVDTGGPRTPATCYVGQRNCESGAWTRCVAYGPRYDSIRR